MALISVHLHEDGILVDGPVQDVVVFLHGLLDHGEATVEEVDLEQEGVRIGFRLAFFHQLVAVVEERKNGIVFYRLEEGLGPQFIGQDLRQRTFSSGDDSSTSQQNSTHPFACGLHGL